MQGSDFPVELDRPSDFEFPVVLEQPGEIEVLGSEPLVAALASAFFSGIAVALLVGFGLWLGSYGGGLAWPVLVAGGGTLAGVLIAYLADAARRRDERFVYFPDRVERHGPGGTWLARYSEITIVQFVTRGRAELLTRAGHSYTVQQMVLSFMRLLRDIGAAEIALSMRQTRLEAGRSVTLQEPFHVLALAIVWLLRFTIAVTLVTYGVLLNMQRQEVAPPFSTSAPLAILGLSLVLLLLLVRFGARRTTLTINGISQGRTWISWRDVARVDSNPTGLEIRQTAKGAKPCRVSWHASNALVLPWLVEDMTQRQGGGGAVVDKKEWGAPWDLI